MKYIIRITKQVEVLQTVEEHEIEAGSIAEAQREATYLLGEKYAMQSDITADVKEKVESLAEKQKEYKEELPF